MINPLAKHFQSKFSLDTLKSIRAKKEPNIPNDARTALIKNMVPVATAVINNPTNINPIVVTLLGI